MNLLYAEFTETIRFNGFRAEDIAALCYLMCGENKPENVKRVCAEFGVEKSSVELVSEFYDFIKKIKPIKIKERAAKTAKKEKNVD